MNRRELVAGIGSVGVLGGAGGYVWLGLPSIGADGPRSGESEDSGPLDVETIDAPGSEAGSFEVPGDGVTVIMFFVTACGNCQSQMPLLADAHEELVDSHGDAVRMLSATYQSPESMDSETLRDWWDTHEGNWPVGYESGLATSYGVVGYPTTIVVDSDGEKQWRETDVLGTDRIVAAVESVLEDDPGS